MLNTFPQTHPQQASRPQAQFVSARARAQIAKALLLANAAVAAVALLVYLYAAAGSPASLTVGEEQINAAELMIGLVALAQLFLYLATAVAYIVWLHRAYKNLHAFGRRTEHSPGWTIGGWFVPFLNLVRPYQIVKETWVKSDPGVDPNTGFADAGTGPRAATVVGVWWGFWLVSNILDNVEGRLLGDATTPDQVSAAAALGVVSSALNIVAAGLAFLVVRTIDRMQEEKAARLSVNAWPAPPPPPTSFEPPAARA